MDNILEKTLKLIDDIINTTENKRLNFYDEVIRIMSSLYENLSIYIFFCENINYTLKKAVVNKKIIDENYVLPQNIVDRIINTEKKYIHIENCNFFQKNTYFYKLAIKNSIFGICSISSNNILNDEILLSFNTLINILSYKIKDYELNEVFKMQVKAIQDAYLEKENAYKIIEKQHKKLQEIDKTKNHFIANISHELRTPLNAIIGFSQALHSEIFGKLNEKQAEYIKDIQISSLHLLGMINEILDLSKLEAKVMSFNPASIQAECSIQEVVNILEPLYSNKNIEVEFISNYKGFIKADFQKFQQILYNLLSNAIKFTPNDGKIQIISETQGKNYILKIIDNGIGIDKKYHSKIFKKFVHLDNVYTKKQNSTGLGLAITKELVKLHNGKITLESETNKGTAFIMEFKNIIEWKIF